MHFINTCFKSGAIYLSKDDLDRTECINVSKHKNYALCLSIKR